MYCSLTIDFNRFIRDITSHINGYNHFSDTDISEFKLIQVPQNSTSRIIFLAEFSAIRTLRRIFTMKLKNNDDSFLFINGIRVLSLCWVIIGHSIAFGLSYANNIVDIIVWTLNIAF
ncbi:unnamed protein product [Adineta steineri]|uniref:Uncharacterized protein n=1 Tax=Adineta steineri TaxID=433720 RepID=A0A813SUW4_9BILA|nr:unnamed protein product [Adineta steineri]CAF3791066.1 unnamed protein product [Adineta steineri]